MNDYEQIEKQIIEGRDQCRDFTNNWIKRCRQHAKRRQWFAAMGVSLQLPAMCNDFYHFHYTAGIVTVIMGMVLACLNWWAWTKTLDQTRRFKREMAKHVAWWERRLKEFREYKERGFE